MAGIWTDEGLLLLQQALQTTTPIEITHFALSGSTTLSSVTDFVLDATLTDATFPSEQFRDAIFSSYIDPVDNNLVVECQVPSDEATEFFMNGIGIIRDDGTTKTLLGIAQVPLQEHTLNVFSRFLVKLPLISDQAQAITLTFAPTDSVTPTEMAAAITAGADNRVFGFAKNGNVLVDESGKTGTDHTIVQVFEATKFVTPTDITVDAIGIFLKRLSAGGAAADLNFGIYTDNAGVPGTKLTYNPLLWNDGLAALAGDSNPVTGTPAGIQYTTFAEYFHQARDILLTSGTYWLVYEAVWDPTIAASANPLSGLVAWDSSNAAVTGMYAESTDGIAWTLTDNIQLSFILYSNSGDAINVRSRSQPGIKAYSDSNVAIYGYGKTMPGIFAQSEHNVAIWAHSWSRAAIRGDAINQVAIYGRSVNGAGVNGVGYSKGVFGKNLASGDASEAFGVGGICTDGIVPNTMNWDETGGTPTTGHGGYFEGRGDAYGATVVASDGTQPSGVSLAPESTRHALRVVAHNKSAIAAQRLATSGATATLPLVNFAIVGTDDVTDIMHLDGKGTGRFIVGIDVLGNEDFVVTNSGWVGINGAGVNPLSQVCVRAPSAGYNGYGLKSVNDGFGWSYAHSSSDNLIFAREFTTADWSTYATRAWMRRGGGMTVEGPDAGQYTLSINAPGAASPTMMVDRITGSPSITSGADSLQLSSPAGLGLNTYDTSDVSLVTGGGNVKVGAGTLNISSAIAGQLQIAGDTFRISASRTISTATDPGNTGEMCRDLNYLYICYASGAWARLALAW